MARQQDGDTPRLKRERAGRYVTVDGRFAVEGDASGAWYVIDAERQDGLGLPLVRGPFPTLDAARETVTEAARTSSDDLPAASTVEPPAAGARGPRVVPPPAPGRSKASPKPRPLEDVEPAGRRPRLRALERPAPRGADVSPAHPPRMTGGTATQGAPDDDPAWLTRLRPEQRADARRLLALLERAGIDNPALVRREIEADLPDVARALLARSIRRGALDPWAAGANAIETLAATGGARDARTRAAKAAVRRLLDGADPDDLARLAWLVALLTSARIFDALGSEGRDAGQGLRGWRLVELGAGRAPTGRTLAIDEPDLLGE